MGIFFLNYEQNWLLKSHNPEMQSPSLEGWIGVISLRCLNALKARTLSIDALDQINVHDLVCEVYTEMAAE